MLTMMRNMLRSKFAGILFLLIIVSMAVWGTEDIFGRRAGGELISAGDRALTVRDLNQTLEFYLFQQRNQGGTILTREQAVENGVVDQLFGYEASRTGLLGYADAIGATATEDTVVEFIRTFEDWQNPETGEFDINLYRNALRRLERSETQQEQIVQDELTLSYLLGASSAALQPPSLLSRIRAIQLAESRTVAWFSIDADTVGPIDPPTDEALEAFYTENLPAFQVPELRSVDVISLSPDDFVHRVDVPEEDLRALYEGTKAQRFSGPERRSFTEAAAANEADARILFGKLAGGAALSEATDSELVSLRERSALRSELVIEDLAEGLFAATAREGTVVGPVEQDGVWIVARVNSIIPGEPIPYEDVRPIVFEELAATGAEGLYFDAGTELQTLIGAGLTLADMAEELDVPILRRLPIAQTGRTRDGGVYLGITDAPELIEEVFNTPEGFVTNPVDYQENTTLIAEVQSVMEAHTPTLDEIRDQVEARYRADTMNNAVQSFADGIVGRIESGETDIASAAEAAGRPLTRPDQAISRANADIGLPRPALAAIFAASEGDVITFPGPLPGQVTLLSVETVTAPSEEEIDVLSGSELPRLATALQADLRAALDIQVRDAVGFDANAAALEAYKASIQTPQ